MRLGGPLFGVINSPDAWVRSAQKAGYRTALCPVGIATPPDEIAAYRDAAERADILISEVGAWSNPIDRDELKSRQAIEHCKKHLALAEQIGAVCCVNIAGSRGEVWDGPDAANDSAETFDRIVQTVQEIIDAVKPTRTVYALETMPWIAPDSPDSYLALLKAIDRRAFGVHLDPANLINSPSRYFHNDKLLRECFEKLGPHICACHAKDIRISSKLTLHLDECAPGEGALDYRVYLSELAALKADVPITLEHLQTESQYAKAAGHIRGVAAELGVTV
jgi:sugar phosphate isomerase/epimerase